VASGMALGLVSGRRDLGSNAASPSSSYRGLSRYTQDRCTPSSRHLGDVLTFGEQGRDHQSRL
jgi:hypothetical protein